MTPDSNVEQPAENENTGSCRKSTGRAFSRQCRRVQSCLIAYLDGDLNGKTRENVARHLEGCAVCRHELRLLAQSEQVLTASAHTLAAPGDLRAGFYARLATAPRPVNKWRAVAPAFAVCGLLLVASGTIYRLRETLFNAAPAAQRQRAGNTFGLASATPPGVTHYAYGMPAAPNAKPLPSVILRPHTQIVLGNAIGQPATVTRRRTYAARPLAAALSAKRELTATGTARNRRPAQRRGLIVIARYFAAASHSALAFAAKPDLSRTRNMQVALIARGERDAFSLTDRATFGRARSRQPASSSRDTLQTEALNSDNAPAREPQTGAFGYDASAGLSLSDVRASAPSEAFQYTHDREDETDGVRFQVKDAQRGFTAATRSESRMQRQNGRQVLSVHLEDQDASPSSAPNQTPEQPKINVEVEPKTGTDK